VKFELNYDVNGFITDKQEASAFYAKHIFMMSSAKVQQ